MPLTSAQIYQIRREVGDSPDDTTLANNYDRLKSVNSVVLEILQIRMANLLRSPAHITVFGEVALDNSANIDALKAQMARLSGVLVDTSGLAGSGFSFARPRSRGR